MAKTSQNSVPPGEMANVGPIGADNAFGQSRVIIDAIKEQISDLKIDVKDIKSDQRTDFRWILGILVTVLIFIVGMLFTVYSNMDDKINGISKENTRIETKLDSLLDRTGPTQAQPPKK
ncbi:MAG: hypothetical protein M3R41_00875 [Pseudomonadota bacterium]|nr:hypothetical protein [Pseudomonadota bacterium]